MRHLDPTLRLTTALGLVLWLTSTAAVAHHGKGGHTTEPDPEPEPCTTCDPAPVADQDWMHNDVWRPVDGAHALGYTGERSRITVIDDFGDTSTTYKGRLRNIEGDSKLDFEYLTHGGWTRLQTQLVAKDALSDWIDFNSGGSYVPDSRYFDVVNLSYGLIARASFASAYNDWSLLGAPHSDVLHAVEDDLAFAAKAAGNDSGAAVGEPVKGTVDVFAQQFIRIIEEWNLTPRSGCTSGTRTVCSAAPIIFVGALDWNPDGTGAGWTTESMASYSSIAGTNPAVQSNFLVVGVEAGRDLGNYGSSCGSVEGTCLYGTSFAAPVVAGYGAIIAEKFPTLVTNDDGTVIAELPPAPSAIAGLLLDTAHGNNLPGGDAGFDRSIYGQGEACLSCALAPTSLY